MTFGERCKKCGHDTNLHHFAEGSNEVYVCDGESMPCGCIRIIGPAVPREDSLSHA